ncbi:membrane associated rhomboid family serine protease [Ciceribacter lividus]|uniref:Membrane associated rhomboid family serine protease n=1 Tax=Ciceribacter lividus TaxID=1197950 RepID=A0A6I7HMV5_9HYPH|nr:rhomboid family intramembrane serine protease [Ciceribacter lividus]RCW26034.1 membrane associated rhomboid family serine protease [Ciceribacter lividus]
MFIPLHDRNGLKHIRRQYVTHSLIALNVVIWLLTGPFAAQEIVQASLLGLGFIPAVVFGNAVLEPSLVLVPSPLTSITYAFLHGNVVHLASNMLFLWVFGDNVEDALGHVRFLLFYLLCAVAGAFAHGALVPTSQSPLIGASGAIAGVVSAYVVLHPRVRIWVLVLFRFPLPLPAFIPLLFWIGQQFWMLRFSQGDNVSWGAHVGGIAAGALLVILMRRPGVPLFDRAIVTPRAVEQRSIASAPTDGETRDSVGWKP